MSAVNNFRDTTDADILNKLRQDIESAKAGSTSQNNFTLNYISPNADTIDITDAITVNGNLQSASDTIDITDAVVQTNVNTGLFQVEDDSSYQKLWLSFDNDVVDKSGNNNSGTITGTETYVSGAIVYPDGRYNKAFSLDGSSYITYPSSSIISGTADRTIAFWLKLSAYPASLGYAVSFGATPNNSLFGIGITSTGNVDVVGSFNDVTGNGVIRLNVWTHVAVTLGSSGTVRSIYLNTTLDKQSTTTALNTTSSSLYVGTAIYNTALTINGVLDDLQIWNYTLSSSDITTLYSGQQIAHNGSVSPVAKVEFCDCAA